MLIHCLEVNNLIKNLKSLTLGPMLMKPSGINRIFKGGRHGQVVSASDCIMGGPRFEYRLGILFRISEFNPAKIPLRSRTKWMMTSLRHCGIQINTHRIRNMSSELSKLSALPHNDSFLTGEMAFLRDGAKKVVFYVG